MMRTLALLAALAAGPAAAQTTVYLCAFDSERSGNWVQPVIQIAHDRATGRVEVLDPLIMSHVGGPVAGSVSTPGNDLRFRWSVADFRDPAGNRALRLAYEVRMSPADGRATGRMRPAGYGGTYSAPGRCRVQG